MTRRNVIYIRPAPRVGFLIWSFVALYYVGIVLPLIMVWMVIKYLVIGTTLVARKIHAGEEARKLNLGEL